MWMEWANGVIYVHNGYFFWDINQAKLNDK